VKQSPGLTNSLVVSSSVWSDDDWLKKFSGKTAEEAEGEESAAPAASTETQEVRLLIGWLSVNKCSCFFMG